MQRLYFLYTCMLKSVPNRPTLNAFYTHTLSERHRKRMAAEKFEWVWNSCVSGHWHHMKTDFFFLMIIEGAAQSNSCNVKSNSFSNENKKKLMATTFLSVLINLTIKFYNIHLNLVVLLVRFISSVHIDI